MKDLNLRNVTVMRYILPLREGGSLPALAEADDDFKYVLKFRGVSLLLALYSVKSAVLTFSFPTSKTTAKCVGFSLLINSINELVNPKIADVSKPLEVNLGFLIRA